MEVVDTYTALITKIKDIRPIKNADFIVSATVSVHDVPVADVVVSKDVQIDDVGIYFCPDIQLSEEYAAANDLIARYDESGKKIGGGFFDEKRRVRAQKFRGVKSDGFWMPMESIAYCFSDASSVGVFGLCAEGYRFQNIGDHEICKRYPKQVIVSGNTTHTVKKQLDVLHFPEHYDTAQIVHYLSDLDKFIGARITITEKQHGSSQRVGNVPIRKKSPLNIIQRINNYFSRYFSFLTPYAEHYYEYGIVHGSRRVILNDANTGFYGTHDFRYNAVGNPALEKDEVLYGEIVGYVDSEKLIMPAHDTSEFKDIKALFGKNMAYTYGLEKGESAFYVYRITRINEQGITYDLSYEEVQKRAFELGYAAPIVLAEIDNWNGDVDSLMHIVRESAERNGYFTTSWYGNHISEGVVILFEKEGKSTAFKYKGLAFKIMEGIAPMPTLEDEEEGDE